MTADEIRAWLDDDPDEAAHVISFGLALGATRPGMLDMEVPKLVFSGKTIPEEPEGSGPFGF